MRVIAVAVATGLALLCGRAFAETPETIMRWIAREPATLLDLGLYRADLDMKRAAENIGLREHLRIKPAAGVIYEFQKQRIRLYLTVESEPPERTSKRCRALFAAVVDELAADWPGGSDRGQRYVEAIFGHRISPTPRPANFAEVLSQAVYLEIKLLGSPAAQASGDAARVVCGGTLDTQAANIEITEPVPSE